MSKKYKRKIVRQGKFFYWYVKSDYDDEGKIKVYILSEDKKFIVAYEIGQVIKQQKKSPFLVVMGKEFVGFVGDRKDIRVQTPPIWDDLSATPSLVGKIIDWCYSEKKEIVLVNWKGELI
ncbi:hypothetical protein OB236_10840 [Paenibacillus sp. WQ 127069]|uniref:Uncharacterized protein n=1 Tax=Paenibacillus baimaensis TaxID=2982185 RepID=A0ABT2UDA7_9BACL|nr:hypothetical protein [Paenibacillus sp. WQ 127069]MCU6792616.1 hypothetical protein [Paenibacillus sp. WQ 127069]